MDLTDWAFGQFCKRTASVIAAMGGHIDNILINVLRTEDTL